MNGIDEFGLWNNENHGRSLQKGLKGTSLTKDEIDFVKVANNSFDIVYSRVAYLHSMRDKGQSKEEAIKLREQFKQDKLKEIRDSRAERYANGDKALWTAEELIMFAALQHPFVDETCPAHAWKVWDMSIRQFFFTKKGKEHRNADANMSPAQLKRNAKIIRELYNEAIK